MAVWRNFLVTLFPWFFKSAIDVANTAANKGSVTDAIKANIDSAAADPTVIAAENAALGEAIIKVSKTKK